MRRSITYRFPLILVGLALLSLMSCGPVERRLVFVAESDPADFTLSNTKPELFNVVIPADAQGPYDLALELTYFDNQLQGWEDLPLYYTVQHPDSSEEDRRFALKLKDEKGGWRGTLKENMTDRVFEQDIATDVSLAAGAHSFKLYGDSKDLTKPILGIVHVSFKVYAK